MLDMGEASLSGYAVVHVKNVIGSPAPVLRLSYANFDRKLTELGEYDDRTRAAYMTRDVELPVLPANIGRRQGTQKRRLELQGQVRVRASRQICRARHLCLIQPRTENCEDLRELSTRGDGFGHEKGKISHGNA